MQRRCTQDCFYVYSRLVMMALLACCMLICMAQYRQQQQPPYAHFCPTWSLFLYFKWQRCRTSLLIFSFFILSLLPFSVSVFLFLLHVVCIMSFRFASISDGWIQLLFNMSPLNLLFNVSFHDYFTLMLEPSPWPRHPILCMSPHCVCPLWPLPPLPPSLPLSAALGPGRG